MADYVLSIPSEIPAKQFLTLGNALVPGGAGPELLSWETHDAAIVVELYLTGQVRDDASHPDAGTLALVGEVEPLTQEAAGEHFKRLGGEGPQAALDPAIKKQLLDFVTKTLLPMLLSKILNF